MSQTPEILSKPWKHRNLVAALGFIGLAATVAPAQAQTLVFGVYAQDFNDADTTRALGFDILTRPFGHLGRVDLGFGAGLLFDNEQNAWIGVGITGFLPLGEKWFAEGSIMPGYFDEGEAKYDLGSSFEVRSLIGLGYRLTDKTALSLSFSHMSNGGTGDTNPGMNTLGLRLRLDL